MTATLERPAPVAPAHELAGTWHLIRLALRRDRVVLPIWIVLLSVVPASTVRLPMSSDLAASTVERRGIAANVTRTIPVLYSPQTASTARMATTAWPS